ncbi:MAG: hypothetical protein SGILL_003208 [Bacillariaceae sp.]
MPSKRSSRTSSSSKQSSKPSSKSKLEVEEDVPAKEQVDDLSVRSSPRSLKPPPREGKEGERTPRRNKRISVPVPVEPRTMAMEPGAISRPPDAPTRQTSGGTTATTGTSGTTTSSRRKPRSQRNKEDRSAKAKAATIPAGSSMVRATSVEKATSKLDPTDVVTPATASTATFASKRASGPEIMMDSKAAGNGAFTSAKVSKRSSGPEVMTDSKTPGSPSSSKRVSGPEIIPETSKPPPSPKKSAAPVDMEDRKPAASKNASRRLSGPDIMADSQPPRRSDSMAEKSMTSDGKPSRQEALDADGKPMPALPGAFHVTPTPSADSNVASLDIADDAFPDADVELGKPGSGSARMPSEDQEQEKLQKQPSKTQWSNTGVENKDDGNSSSLHMPGDAAVGVPIAAELVPDEDELERRMEERLKKELDKRLEQEREQHVVAEAVQIDDERSLPVIAAGDRSVMGVASVSSPTAADPPKKRNRLNLYIVIAAICLVVLVAGIIGGVVSGKNKDGDIPAPTMGPTVVTTDSYQEMVATIGDMVASDTYIFFSGTDTPQYLAMDWLANFDTWASSESRDPEQLSERYSLGVLYFATDGPNWAKQLSFLTGASVCDWNDGLEVGTGKGVYCRPDEFVQGIWLELGLFPHAEALEMSGELLEGTIPTEIFSLLNLTSLDFFDTSGLTGSIPTEIAVTSKLESLLLGGNSFNGNLPEELYELTVLTFLDLTFNGFSGSLSTSISKLSQLEYFSIAINKLRGPIPDEAYALSQLTTLWTFQNILTGTLSTQVGLLSNIIDFDVASNNLRGNLPSELGNLRNSTNLFLEDNDFVGTLPTDLAELTKLKELVIYDNFGLEGLVPRGLANLRLSTVRVDGTDLLGIEEAFCSSGREYDEMAADCLGDDPKVECSCCDTCCDSDGQNCEDV